VTLAAANQGIGSALPPNVRHMVVGPEGRDEALAWVLRGEKAEA
jgi:hypothetical protein